MSFNQSVYNMVRRIPCGKVATYGQIAALVGAPRKARQVGWALHHNPLPGEIPCHRVVFRDGKLTDGFAFGGLDAQHDLLAAEGVAFDASGRVNLALCLWDGSSDETACKND